MNASKQSSADLLIVSTDKQLPEESVRRIMEQLNPLADTIGVTSIFLQAGMKAEMHRDLSGLIEAIEKQAKATADLVIVNQQLLDAIMAEEEGDQPSSGGYLNE